jgi:hypothetical protein
MSNELDQEQVILKNHVIAGSYSIAVMYQQKRLRWKSKTPFFVIPAKAGIQFFQLVTEFLDSDFHRSDDFLRDRQNLSWKSFD